VHQRASRVAPCRSSTLTGRSRAEERTGRPRGRGEASERPGARRRGRWWHRRLQHRLSPGAEGVLVDKGEFTSRSTWHAAGMVTHFHTSPTITRMRAYAVRRLLAALGLAPRAAAGPARPRRLTRARSRPPPASTSPSVRGPGGAGSGPHLTDLPSPCRALRRGLHSAHRNDATPHRDDATPGRTPGRWAGA
jgi:hypothetical protein